MPKTADAPTTQARGRARQTIAEAQRLEESRAAARPLEALGPVPQRAGLGHASARTTAQAATPGTTSRTTTRARAPIAGTKTAWPGICDRHQRICFALALWNGRDPILKERLFGLTGSEGNHGEDVKEYYFYLDSTPTHSYMRFLYKYPQAAFPYGRLVEENRRRGKDAAGVRADRHRRLRREPLLRRRGRVREGRSRRHPDPDSRHQPRPGDRAARSAADGLVPQHVVVGTAADRPRAEVAQGDAAVHRAHRDRPTAALAPLRRRARRCSSPRTTRTPQRLFGYANDASLHEGRVPPLSSIEGESGAVNPARAGNQGRGALRR